MKVGATFWVPADSARVFDLFLDAPTMRACIPGCEELVRVDETHYTGRIVTEIARFRFNAAFSAQIIGIDPPREVRAALKATDRMLASSLTIDATLRVSPEDEGSTVAYTMEMAMGGLVGRIAESIFQRRTAEAQQQFAQAFTKACAGDLPDDPAAGADSPGAR